MSKVSILTHLVKLIRWSD